MSRKSKLGWASAVLLAGTVVAMFDRHPLPPPPAPRPAKLARPVLRSWKGPSASGSTRSVMKPGEITQASPVREPSAMIRASLEKNEPPPRLARDYPDYRETSSFGAGVGAEYRLPEPPDSRPAIRIHKVAEGDTLALLAERYLGSAARAVEIFELNRGALSAPDALPLGEELKIPPRSAPAAEEGDMLPPRPLVPVGS